MKILYVSHLFLPRYSGGTEVLTFQVAREMQRRGHGVQVLSCEDFAADEAQVSGTDQPYEGLAAHRLRLNPAHSRDALRAHYYFADVENYLLPWLRALRPELLHVHHFGFVTTAVATAAYRLGIPVVFTATDFWLICPTSQLLRHDQSLCDGPTNIAKCAKCVVAPYRRGHPYQRLLQVTPEPLFNLGAHWVAPRLREVLWPARAVASLVERADWNRGIAHKFSRLLVASDFMRQAFVRNRVPAERMQLVGFGIDTSWAAGLEPRRAHSPLRVGFIGTISPHKGLHVLLQAFRRLGAGTRAQLTIYGNVEQIPAYGESVKAQAAGESEIHFRGTFPHHEIDRVLGEMDALVIPSVWYENTPLVLNSALAAKLPVIVSDMGGLVELIRDGENGLVVPRENPEALAAALERCLREPELLPRLSRQMTPVKDTRAYVDELVSIYEEVLR